MQSPTHCNDDSSMEKAISTQTQSHDANSISLNLYDDIKLLIKDDILATDTLIIEELKSDVVLINQLGLHIINSGGKRLRPLLTLLSSRALEYDGKQHHLAAAIIEFIHTATLLHDDVIDASDLRRGQQTANAIFGNEASVLTGDFLYSRAFQMMVRLNSLAIMDIFADTTNKIAEGEVLQLMNCNNPELTESDYYDVIQRKTAILFGAACELGAVLSSHDQYRSTMNQYGLYLGIAFQIIDDMLDYVADEKVMGKHQGNDLGEGKTTLPLIYAQKVGSSSQKILIQNSIKDSDCSKLLEINRILEETHALDYCYEQAKVYTQKALDALSPMKSSPYKDALILLTKLALKRTH